MYSLNLVVITGLSGAGRSVCAKVMEDLGYYTIDNMPLFITEKFVDVFFELGVNTYKIAFVIDSRAGSEDDIYRVISLLKEKYDATILFLTASDGVLIRRYKEIRRKHPLGLDLVESIKKERALMDDIKDISDLVLDTSNTNIHEFRSEVSNYFQGAETDFTVYISSFGFKYGLPVDSDLVFDVRFIRNPHFVENMRSRTGKEEDVRDYVLGDESAIIFIEKLIDMLKFLIPMNIKEGKRYLKISIGCTGGRHRSVAIVENVANCLASDYSVNIKHRDINL